jgi:TPR repeat protein
VKLFPLRAPTRVLLGILFASVVVIALVFPLRMALYGWGSDMSERGDYRPAFTLIRISAVLGYPYGKSTLGAMYLSGQGADINGAEAAYWLESASHDGDAQAQVVLGMMYLFGKSIVSDREKARYWLTRAAAGGDREAAGLLTAFYTKSAQ